MGGEQHYGSARSRCRIEAGVLLKGVLCIDDGEELMVGRLERMQLHCGSFRSVRTCEGVPPGAEGYVHVPCSHVVCSLNRLQSFLSGSMHEMGGGAPLL